MIYIILYSCFCLFTIALCCYTSLKIDKEVTYAEFGMFIVFAVIPFWNVATCLAAISSLLIVCGRKVLFVAEDFNL